jgi:hypothetical protein
LLDAVFGADKFWNEIIWKRTSGHSDASRYGRVHDVLLYYSKAEKPKWNKQYQPYDEAYVRQYYRYADPDGRRFMSGDLGAAGLRGGGYEYTWKGVQRTWRVPKETMQKLDDESRIFYTRNGIPRIKRYLDEAKGLPVQDVWTDIEALRSWHAEKLGYPTQKPEALLERIIRANTDEGDTVLDPFCGCGTASEVAHRLKRRWIGIDITHLAVAVIRYRLRRDFTGVKYNVVGEPESLPDAEALAAEDPYQFQWWALGLLGINPMQKKKGADKGIDGRLYFHERGDSTSTQVVISVKAGQTNVAHVCDLVGVLDREKAQIGVLVTLKEPTQPMRIEAVSDRALLLKFGHTSPSSPTPHGRTVARRTQHRSPYIAARARRRDACSGHRTCCRRTAGPFGGRRPAVGEARGHRRAGGRTAHASHSVASGRNITKVVDGTCSKPRASSILPSDSSRSSRA